MCGRFTQKSEHPEITEEFYIDQSIDIPEQQQFSWNITPSQNAYVVLNQDNQITLQYFRFGLVPEFAKSKDDLKKFYLNNARSETIFEKVSFKKSILKKRCIIPINGYYEWQSIKGKKQPYYFHIQNKPVFGIAGIYSEAKLDGELYKSFSIITKAAEAKPAAIHDRMPIIIERHQYKNWLGQELDEKPDKISDYINQFHGQGIELYPVSSQMNKPSFNTAACIAKIDLTEELTNNKIEQKSNTKKRRNSESDAKNLELF